MSPRRFQRRSAPRTTRQRLSWWQTVFQFQMTSAADQQVADLTPEPLLSTTTGQGNATIRRFITTFSWTYDGASAVADVAHDISVGVAVVTQDALAAGAMPDPLTDPGQDWYYWTHRQMKIVSANNQPMHYWEIDIRTARRLRGGYRLALIVQNPVQEEATNLNVATRALWVQQP